MKPRLGDVARASLIHSASNRLLRCVGVPTIQVSIGRFSWRRVTLSGTYGWVDDGKENSMEADTKTWPDLAAGLYDKLTGRNTEITYEFNDFEIHVPSSATESATHAKWKMSGVLKIRTRDVAKS